MNIDDYRNFLLIIEKDYTGHDFIYESALIHRANSIIRILNDTEYMVIIDRFDQLREHGHCFSNFIDLLNLIHKKYEHILIYDGSDKLIIIDVKDLVGDNPLSEWYHNRRGYYTSKNFNI